MAADTVAQIKEKLTIVDVVGTYVKLTRAGRNYKGLSPFNKEKTPSFYVNPERGSYFCFSSGQGGDMFTFIEKMEGVDFKGALKLLADKAGVEVVYERGASREDKDKKDRLYEAMARAESYYTAQLLESKDIPGSAYAYALSRGLTEETVKTWGLGFAPAGWRAVFEKLTADGFTQAELLSAGLIKEADEKKGTFYDRFRNRLMFPIRDGAGRTVAFTGRALDPNDQAKYLNSPETELYKKSEILFGMDKAKDAIRQRGFTLLVEGQMDLLMLHQIGFGNTVALSGTALTPQHLSLMKRYADNLMLALDSDRAGLAATQKNAKTALLAGMEVKAVRLPAGKDPADSANDDPKALTKAIAEAPRIVDYFLIANSEVEPDPIKLIQLNRRTVLDIVSAISDEMKRSHYIEKIARSTDLDVTSVRDELRRLRNEQLSQSEKPLSATTVSGAKFQLKETQSRKLARALKAIVMEYEGEPLAIRVKNEYARIIGAPSADDTPLSEREVFEAGNEYGEHPDEHAADELIKVFERAYLTEVLSDLTRKLSVAESASDEMLIRALSDECRSITRRLASLS